MTLSLFFTKNQFVRHENKIVRCENILSCYYSYFCKRKEKLFRHYLLEEVIISEHQEVSIDSDEGQPCTMIVIQRIGDGREKEIYRADIQPNSTFVYSAPSGISAVTTEQSAGKFYDLQGRQLKGNPTQRGIYIVNGKKVVK